MMHESKGQDTGKAPSLHLLDVIILTALEMPIVEGQLDLNKQLSFIWDKTHSVDTVRRALDRLLRHFMMYTIFRGIAREELK